MTKEEEFKSRQANLSDGVLIQLCKDDISMLCKTRGSGIRMSIPPSVYDTDMLFCELIRRYKEVKS